MELFIMKLIFLVLSFMSLLTSFTICAERHDITFDVSDGGFQELTKVSPQLYIFDNTGQLIFYSAGVVRDIVKKFELSEPVPISESKQKQLFLILPKTIPFDQYGYTMVFINDSEADKYCPPCVTQEKINAIAIEARPDLSISYYVLNSVFKGEQNFEMLSTEEFDARYGNPK
jgi:hypothetical protein